VNLELICQLATARPHWSIVMIGSVGEGDPWTDSAMLNEHANVYLIGARSYEELPAYLKGFDVALMPNMLNEYTRSMFPMKFFEYLAAGKSVVSVNLHALQEFADIACITKDLEGFIAGVETALAGGGAPLEKRLEVAERYTYKARTKKMLELMAALPEERYSALQQPRVAIP
jgi:glycosyltransferase involved in cell wall biosynthesis